MIRAVAYYRKSNEDAGESIDQQRAWAAEACLREGVLIVREFEDQAKSGLDTARRSGFLAMIEFCEQQDKLGRPVEAVACWHANRFSRADSLETSAFLHQLVKAGTTRMLTQGKWIDFKKSEDRMIFGLEQEATSHRYLTDLSAATLRGKKTKAKNGTFMGGRPPYGYRVDRPEPVPGLAGEHRRPAGRLMPDPDRAAVVRGLFEQYATGRLSLKGLADDLRARGVPSPTGRPLWTDATVSKLLRNELYLGDYLFGRHTYSKFAGRERVKACGRQPQSGLPNDPSSIVRVPATHPPLVTRDLFDRVQALLAANRSRTNPRNPRADRYQYLLSGLVECGRCGRRMYAVTERVKGHTYRVYVCPEYHRHRSGNETGCGRNAVREDHLVRAVANALALAYGGEGQLAALEAELYRQLGEAAGRHGEAEAALVRRRDDLDGKMDTLTDRLAEPLPPDVLERVRKKLTSLSAERAGVEADLTRRRAVAGTEDVRATVERVLDRAKRLAEVLPKAPPTELAALIRETVDRVPVYFTSEQQGRRTRTAVANVLVYLKAEAWVTPPTANSPTVNRRSC